MIIDLLDFTSSHSTSTVSVAATGLFPLFRQMSDDTTKNFEIIDGTGLICLFYFFD
jgi:hypothetical protein